MLTKLCDVLTSRSVMLRDVWCYAIVGNAHLHVISLKLEAMLNIKHNLLPADFRLNKELSLSAQDRGKKCQYLEHLKIYLANAYFRGYAATRDRLISRERSLSAATMATYLIRCLKTCRYNLAMWKSSELLATWIKDGGYTPEHPALPGTCVKLDYSETYTI